MRFARDSTLQILLDFGNDSGNRKRRSTNVDFPLVEYTHPTTPIIEDKDAVFYRTHLTFVHNLAI